MSKAPTSTTKATGTLAPGTESEAEVKLIKANNGRTYKEGPDGNLREVFVREDHAQRLLDSIPDNALIGGLRITNAGDPDEKAVVVTFDEKESSKVLAAVKEVLEDRTGA